MTICCNEGCRNYGYYNFPNEVNKLFCNQHRQPEMICMSIRKCEENGCVKQPNYNYENKNIKTNSK